MNAFRALAIVAILSLSLVGGSLATADDQPVEFLHVLQKQGYGDVAVEYIKSLQAKKEVPEDLQDVLDLEMCNSLRASADEAINPEQAQHRLAEAQSYLDKFLKEKPDHPEVAEALTSWGNFGLQRGVEKLTLAQGAAPKTDQEKADQAKLFTEARQEFESARDRFKQSADRFSKQVVEARKDEADNQVPGKAPPPSRNGKVRRVVVRPGVNPYTARRQELEYNWAESRFRLALVDFYVSQTYPAPDSPERKKSLQLAAKGFDDIYQAARNDPEGMKIPSMFAHLWHGRAVAEMGSVDVALDIYEECQGWDSEEKGAAHGPAGPLESFFAQVEYFKILALAKKDPGLMITEAKTWREEKLKLKQDKTDGFMGVTLEMAKMQLDLAGKADPKVKPEFIAAARSKLQEVARFRGSFQSEGIRLLRDLKGDAGVEGSSFDEAVTYGDLAASGRKWDEAAKHFTRALELAKPTTDPKLLKDVTAKLSTARYYLIYDKYSKSDFEGAAADAEKMTKDLKDPKAMQAGILRMSCFQNLYVKAADDATRTKWLPHWEEAAQWVIKNWPDKEGGDDARMTLANLSFIKGDIKAGRELLEAVNEASPKYATAMRTDAISYLREIDAEHAKPEADRNKDLIKTANDNAIERLSKGVKALQSSSEGTALSKDLTDLQLLLAKIELDAGRPEDSLKTLQPMLDAAKQKKAEGLDSSTLQIYVLTVKAYVALQQFDKAKEVATVLIQSGEDIPEVNGVLVKFTKLVEAEVNKAQAAEMEATSDPDPKKLDAAQADLKRKTELLAALLTKLSERENLSKQEMLYVGIKSADVDLPEQADAIYRKLLDKIKGSKEPNDAALETAVLTRQLAIQRKQGKFEAAKNNVDLLIAKYPNAMDPMIEKGQILQAWAEREKTAARFEDAVKQWTDVRVKLSHMKQRPNEYYEVVYNAARCLLEQSKFPPKDPKKSQQAEQILNASLVLSPQLGGRPDMVAKYNSLLKEIQRAEGKTPAPATSKN